MFLGVGLKFIHINEPPPIVVVPGTYRQYVAGATERDCMTVITRHRLLHHPCRWRTVPRHRLLHHPCRWRAVPRHRLLHHRYHGGTKACRCCYSL